MKKIFGFIIAVAAAGLIYSCNGNKAEASTEAAEQEMEGEAVPASEDAVSENVLNNPNFRIEDHAIISDNLPVVVDFYTTWCGPCKRYAPVFHAVAQKYVGVAVFVRIDAEQYPDIAATYGVEAYPTTVFLSTGGVELGSQSGTMDEATLTTYVNQLVSTAAGADMEI